MPLTLVTFVILVLNGSAFAQAPQSLAVPSEFIKYINMPGTGDVIKRPSALHYDRYHDELLVGDSGNNRVVIFGPDGVFRFEFATHNFMTMPMDIATDPDGYIHVLGSSRRSQVLFRFDFDGVEAGSISVPREWAGDPVELRSIACDEDATLYALDHKSRRILVIRDGVIERAIMMHQIDPVEETELSERLGAGYALGTICYSDGSLYVPVGDVGSVQRYSTDGTHLGNIGVYGSEPGTLNFPVAVEVSPDGIVLVLDKPRFTVVCFAPDGRFLGEFGGRGVSPGWFMGPSLLAVASSDRIIVGQVYQSRIQICALPDFISGGLDRAENTHSASVPGRTRLAMADCSSTATSQRRLVADSRNNAAAGGDNSSSFFNTAQYVQCETYLEVSE